MDLSSPWQALRRARASPPRPRPPPRRAENLASIRLHQRLGFQRAGTLHQVGCKFGRWLDLAFLERRLDDRVSLG